MRQAGSTGSATGAPPCRRQRQAACARRALLLLLLPFAAPMLPPAASLTMSRYKLSAGTEAGRWGESGQLLLPWANHANAARNRAANRAAEQGPIRGSAGGGGRRTDDGHHRGAARLVDQRVALAEPSVKLGNSCSRQAVTVGCLLRACARGAAYGCRSRRQGLIDQPRLRPCPNRRRRSGSHVQHT